MGRINSEVKTPLVLASGCMGGFLLLPGIQEEWHPRMSVTTMTAGILGIFSSTVNPGLFRWVLPASLEWRTRVGSRGRSDLKSALSSTAATEKKGGSWL